MDSAQFTPHLRVSEKMSPSIPPMPSLPTNHLHTNQHAGQVKCARRPPLLLVYLYGQIENCILLLM